MSDDDPDEGINGLPDGTRDTSDGSPGIDTERERKGRPNDDQDRWQLPTGSDDIDPEELTPEDPEPDTEAALNDPVAAEMAPNQFAGSVLGDGYGPFRRYFKRRPNEYWRLQRRLNQARIRDTYDEYLTRSLRRSVLAGLLGLATGLALVLLAGLDTGSFGAGIFPSVSRELAADARLVAEVVGIPVGMGLVAGLTTWLWLTRIRPVRMTAARRRGIDLTLPYAVTFLYALTDGGADLLVAVRELAAAGDVYGESAKEFDRVIREMELFGNDFQTALRNTARVTPSEEFREFADDLLSVVSAGGEIDRFLEEEVDDYLETAEEKQAEYVETLALLSEGFVVGFVAAPLFLIVILTIVSFLGAETLELLTGIIYVLFPLGIALFVILVDVLSAPYIQPAVELEIDREPAWAVDESTLQGDERFERHRRIQRRRRLRSAVGEITDAVRSRPALAFGLTVPAGLAVAGAAVLTGIVEPSIEALLADPLGVTVVLGVLPGVVMTLPVSLLHERRVRRERDIVDRFPDLLELLANTNQIGVEMTDALRTVSQWASGGLGGELKKVENDIRWNEDTPGALLRFADRLEVPQLSRTMKLVTEGSRVTSDLHEVLDIAARSTRAHVRMAETRRRELSTYIAIVVIGFLVYLLVLGIISESFLGPMEELAASVDPSADDPGGATLIPSLPVDAYRVLFFHSALLQGVGSGILAGKLAENTVLSGLKYGIGLALLSVVVFAVILP